MVNRYIMKTIIKIIIMIYIIIIIIVSIIIITPMIMIIRSLFVSFWLCWKRCLHVDIILRCETIFCFCLSINHFTVIPFCSLREVKLFILRANGMAV